MIYTLYFIGAILTAILIAICFVVQAYRGKITIRECIEEPDNIVIFIILVFLWPFFALSALANIISNAGDAFDNFIAKWRNKK